MAKAQSSTAVAKREDIPPPTALALSPNMGAELVEAFRDGADVQIPANAERVEFVPSYTVPVGATVQGQYGGTREEETVNAETGEVSKFDSFLFKNLNGSGQDVWLRGGWNFGQLIKLAKTREGERITMKRNPDKQHPRDPRLRIAEFDYYRG